MTKTHTKAHHQPQTSPITTRTEHESSRRGVESENETGWTAAVVGARNEADPLSVGVRVVEKSEFETPVNEMDDAEFEGAICCC
ncbi:unnamed protein product [Rhodiola kirilowii]